MRFVAVLSCPIHWSTRYVGFLFFFCLASKVKVLPYDMVYIYSIDHIIIEQKSTQTAAPHPWYIPKGRAVNTYGLKQPSLKGRQESPLRGPCC